MTIPMDAERHESDIRATKRRKVDVRYGGVDYNNGLFLAPMVRIGTLPTRLLALEYGASLVWGPEIVDRAIIDAERTEEPSGVVRFVKDGSAHVQQALEAAKRVEDLVAGVGLNCGCPKSFSVHGGMGAELLKVPDKLCAILENLVQNLSVPVSCKIRLLPDRAATILLVKRIAQTGIVQLTVHCRTQDMRPREPALLDRLSEIVDAVEPYGIPVAANGDCFRYEDIERIKRSTGVTSIMIARGAESNVSVFRPEGPLDPVEEVIPRYLQIARAVSHPWGNCKYVLQTSDLAVSPVIRNKKQRNAIAQRYLQAKSVDAACQAFNIDLSAPQSLEDLLPNLLLHNDVSRRKELQDGAHSTVPASGEAKPVVQSIETSRCTPASAMHKSPLVGICI